MKDNMEELIRPRRQEMQRCAVSATCQWGPVWNNNEVAQGIVGNAACSNLRCRKFICLPMADAAAIPGPGGWAFILRHPASGKEMEHAGGEALTTNNRMELLAVIKGLEALKRTSRVDLFTDSEYVRQGLVAMDAQVESQRLATQIARRQNRARSRIWSCGNALMNCWPSIN